MPPVKLNSVMLIDDDDTVNFYNEFLLKDRGITDNVIIAENGEKGLQYLEKCAREGLQFPSLIFLDINMPVMNGFEFIEAYQELPDGQKAKALVVMLTTSMHPEDLKRAEQFDAIKEYIYKPLLPNRLEEVLNKFF